MNPCNSTHPFACWEKRPGGLYLRTFADEYLAAQFAVNNGTTVISNPIQ